MEEAIELREIIQEILKGKWIIAICTIIALIFSGVISWFALEEKYESKAIVQISGGAQDTGVMSNYVATEFTSNVYMQRMQNATVANEAFLEKGYNKFNKNNLTLTNQPNTNLVEITYVAGEAELAQKKLQLLLDETKEQMDRSVKITLNQLEQTYLNEANSLSNEIEKLMARYNTIIRDNKLPEVLILQTIASSQFVLNLSSEQSSALSSITGKLQNELLQLKAQIDTKSNEYRVVLTKYQSVKTGLDSFKPDPFIRVIIEPTRSEYPTAPNKLINLIIGFVLGIVIGLGIIFFKIYFGKLLRPSN